MSNEWPASFASQASQATVQNMEKLGTTGGESWGPSELWEPNSLSWACS